MLQKQELLEIHGGAFKLTAAFISSIARLGNTLMDVGRSIGSAIRRSVGGTMCPIS